MGEVVQEGSVKVCLITPPSEFLLDERVFVSLGILKVASALEASGILVDHLDLAGVENYMDVVKDYASTHSPDCYALTATTPQMPSATLIAAFLRPLGRVILGGPHATLVNAAGRKENPKGRGWKALQELVRDFDAVVAGDGEVAIFRAMKENGLIDADDPGSALWQKSSDFEASPWPSRHLIDMESYHYSVDGRRATSAVFQLGCPFECGFCGGRNSFMLRRIRTRTADSVVAELMHIYNTYGITGIMCYDDELNVNKGLVELLRKIKATGVDWRLRGFVKSELFNEEQAEALYAAGFRWLLCGFESAHPKILKNINKKATVEDNTRMLRTAHKYGLKVKALMSFGHPGESAETIEATKQWILEERPDDFDCTIITTYPGCPYYDNARLLEGSTYVYEFNGDRLYSEDASFAQDAMYYKGKPGDYKSYVWTDHLSPERLVELRDEVESEVRAALEIPYNVGQAALRYEHSMGMGLPPSILRTK
jgi:radical SAM superfamily enzyme YgiQ (UPF0313 family)